MSITVSDQLVAERLQATSERTELRDPDGRLLGLFTPLSVLAPPMSGEELDRRAAESGGRPLSEILRDLEARA